MLECGLPLPCENTIASNSGSSNAAIAGIATNDLGGNSLHTDGVYGFTTAISDLNTGFYAGVHGEAAQSDIGVNGTLLKAAPHGESAMNISRWVSALIILLMLSVPPLAHAQYSQCGLPLPCTQGTAGNEISLYIGNNGNQAAIFGVGTNDSSTTGINNGVSGLSVRNNGVAGFTTAISDLNTGFYAGVYGQAANSDGVIGTSSSGAHAGVSGANTAGGNGIYGESASGYAGYFVGDVGVNGDLSVAGSKQFKIDHPLDPANQTLSHASVESPDMMNIYTGNTITDAQGDATVLLPAYFEPLNRDFRYQLTVIEQFAQAIISSEIKDNRFTIKTDKPGVKVSWMVTGVRQDAYAQAHPISVEQYKAADDRGKYLHPALYGQPKEMGVNQSRLETLQMQMEADATARGIWGEVNPVAEQMRLTEKMLMPKE